MSDAARAKAREVRRNIEGLSMFDVEAERTIASALGEYAAEQTAALRAELESYKDSQVMTIPAQDLDSLREENARLWALLKRISDSGILGAAKLGVSHPIVVSLRAILAESEGQRVGTVLDRNERGAEIVYLLWAIGKVSGKPELRGVCTNKESARIRRQAIELEGSTLRSRIDPVEVDHLFGHAMFIAMGLPS